MLTDDEKEMTEILAKSLGSGMLKDVQAKTEDAKRLGDARYALTQQKLDEILTVIKEIRRNGNSDRL